MKPIVGHVYGVPSQPGEWRLITEERDRLWAVSFKDSGIPAETWVRKPGVVDISEIVQ